jgi:hypothetical protein
VPRGNGDGALGGALGAGVSVNAALAPHPARVVFRDVTQPEMTTLVLQVVDEDVGNMDDELAECFVPLHILRPGLRCFPMRSPTTGQTLEGCFVLAFVSFHTDLQSHATARTAPPISAQPLSDLV